MSVVPEGWVEAPLIDVVTTRSGNSKLIKGKLSAAPTRAFPVPAFSASGQDVWCAQAEYTGAGIVVSAVGARCGKSFLASGEWTAIANTHVIIPTDAIDARFLWYRLNDERFWIRGGSAQPFVRVARTLEAPALLPPLAEQRRIVAAIEEQFSRLEAAVWSVARGRQLLDALRVASIDAAFDHSWAMHPFSTVARVSSNLVDPADYPSAPHVAPNHIEAGTGRLLPYQTIAEDGVTSPKHLFRPGQILYSKIRPYLKKAVVAEFEGLCSADMYPIDSDLDVHFLRWWMLSERFTAEAIKQQGRSVLPKINKEGLARLSVPVPPGEEQRAAANGIERQVSLIDALRGALESAQKRASALRRAILERAFHGQLVPQDPDDEPASVLLDRIRAERTSAPKAKRRKQVTA